MTLIANPITAAAKLVLDAELPYELSPGVRVSNLLELAFDHLNAIYSNIESEDGFQHNFADSSGLSFAYHGATLHDGKGNLTTVSGSSVVLTGDATNYIEFNPADSSVSANTSGFTAGRIPMFTVVAGTSSFSNADVTSKRPFLAALKADTVEVDELADELSGLINTVDITVGAESSNVIDVDIQVIDTKSTPNNVEARRILEVFLSDSDGGGVTETAPDGVEVQSGTPFNVITADKHLRLMTTANGAATVRISETGAGTWYLGVRLQDRVVYSDAITFTT